MNIFFIATRIAGNDGVTLEAKNWKGILERMGHTVTLVAGELDIPGILLPELHFQSPTAKSLYDKVIDGKATYKQVEAEIFSQAGNIEGTLRELLRKQKVDLLFVPNVLSLPMHFALAVGLSRVIQELKLPTLARHHDFWWERERFALPTFLPFFQQFFPPMLPNIKHIVINSLAQKEFETRTGCKAAIIWDTIDYTQRVTLDTYSKHWRDDFGIAQDDCVFLQATRLVPRKRIELAIHLLEKMNDPKSVLVIAGRAGDEGQDYEIYLQQVALKSSARIIFIGEWVEGERRTVEQTTPDGKIHHKRIYTLWDCYNNADFATYPTELEGFGNQFVEAVFYKKPIILTRYPVFQSDIEPKGFSFIEYTQPLSKTIHEIGEIRNDKKKEQRMINNNFTLGKKYLSFDWSQAKITECISALHLYS